MSELKALTRADIDGKRSEKWLPVPELGGRVLLRSLSLNEYMDLLSTIGDNNGQFGKMLVANMLIDPETNEPMYGVDELDEIGDGDGNAMFRIINGARELIGLTSNVPKASDSESSATASTATASNSLSDSEKA